MSIASWSGISAEHGESDIGDETDRAVVTRWRVSTRHPELRAFCKMSAPRLAEFLQRASLRILPEALAAWRVRAEPDDPSRCSAAMSRM